MRDQHWLKLGAATGLTLIFCASLLGPLLAAPLTQLPIGCILGRNTDEALTGLAGWTIHASPRNDAERTLTTTTDASGAFYFTGLNAGAWLVSQEAQPGWAPVTAPSIEVTVGDTLPCAQAYFANRQVCVTDLHEPDDDWHTASLISPGETQPRTLEPASDLDWVMFDAVRGRVYTLGTYNLAGQTDTYLTLYDTDAAALLAYSDDISAGQDLRSQITWRAPATGRYYARVRNFSQEGTRGCLAYDLALSAREYHYLPLIAGTALESTEPAPSVTPTATPTISPTPTVTHTPAPPLPPIVIEGIRSPNGMAANWLTHELYITSRDSAQVYRVDPVTGVLINAIEVGGEPFGVAVNSLTNKIYVANFRDNSLSVIDGNSQRVTKTISLGPFGEPTYVAVDQSTNRIYAALHAGGRLAVIDGATDTLIAAIDVGAGAFGVAVDPILKRAYVSCRDPRLIRVIDTSTNLVRWGEAIHLAGMPYALGINPNLNRLYVSYAPEGDNPRQVLVYRIPETGPSLLTTVLVGNGGANGGGGVTANPITGRVFASNSADNTLSVFDGLTDMLIDTVPVGKDPFGTAIDPVLGYVFTGNRGSNSASGIPDSYSP